MIKETGTVISVEPGALWVQTSQKSACQSCPSEKGCGQGTLSKKTTAETTVRALLRDGDESSFRPGDSVEIGVPEGLLVSATLLLYLLPLLTLLVGIVVAQTWSGSDSATALGALVGLLFGGCLVRFNSYRQRNNPGVHPVVLEKKLRNLSHGG